MRLLILILLLVMSVSLDLDCAEPHVIPVDRVTHITLEYSNGDEISINFDAEEIWFAEKKDDAAAKVKANKVSSDQLNQVKEDLLKLITNGLSEGLFTKESSGFISATIVFSGPTLKYLPRNDIVADKIGEFGKSLKARFAK